MDIKKLQKLVVDALEDVKAQDVQIFDTTHLTSMFDRIAIASGTANRQTKALASSVRDKVKAAGGKIVSIEGEKTGEWVLVDLGDMIVHIMQPTIRAYYRLEEIWGDKPVKLVAKRVTKNSSPAAQKASAARKTPAKAIADKPETEAPKKRAPRKTTAKTGSPEPAAKKSPPRKTVSTKSKASATADPKAGKPAPKRTTTKKTTAKA